MINESQLPAAVRIRTNNGARHGLYIGRVGGRGRYRHQLRLIYLEDDASPHGVKVRRRPEEDLRYLTELQRDGVPYSPTEVARRLRLTGERRGISNEAAEVLHEIWNGTYRPNEDPSPIDDRSTTMSTSKRKKGKAKKKSAKTRTSPRTTNGKAKTKQVRAAAVDLSTVPVPRDLTKPKDGESSGAFIRRLLKEKKWADEVLAAAVRKYYEGRKTTTKDVAWNRSKLRSDEGVDLTRLSYEK